MSWPPNVVVWWLSQEAWEMAAAFGAPEVAGWPSYIRREFESREGRPGRARLWVAGELGIEGDFVWSVPEGDPRWEALQSCGGISLRAEDAKHVLSWPGLVTDLTLQPIRAEQIKSR